jgi:A/G-specific adenine glycosylase
MNQIRSRLTRTIQRKVLRWYMSHGRDLPWRRTRIPYKIFLSELMLQQTQVDRVIPKFREFLRVFPSFRAVARATPGQVVSLWQGLGYNRRALWLHSIARSIVRDHQGRLPRTYEELRSLPGIGEYTARAIRVFAFDQQEAVVDVNVARVLHRIFRLGKRSVDQNFARSLLPTQKAYAWNQALMDIGSAYCTASWPDCAQCPVRSDCLSAGKVRVPEKSPDRKEPSRYGVPRRIYRGRILKAVHQAPFLSKTKLAHTIGLTSRQADLRWLREVVDTLSREGFLRVSRVGTSWNVRRAK